MKTLSKLIPLAVLAVFVVQIMLDVNPRDPPSGTVAKPVEKKLTSSYGQRGADNGWPTILPGALAQAGDRLARNYYLVLDGSGSMNETNCTSLPSKLEEARAAVTAFSRQLPDDALLGAMVFDAYGIREVLPIGPYDANRLEKVLNAMTSGGGTPLARAMEIGYRALQKQAVAQLGNGEFNLVVVTDGIADTGQDVTGTVWNIVSQSPVNIHAIGFCIDGNNGLNQPGITRYTAARDGEALKRGLAAVLAEAPDFDASSFSPEPVN